MRPQLTVAEHLRFWAALVGGDAGRAASPPSASRRSPTARWRSARPASGAASRSSRLALAPRRLWLLDEPTAALDAEGAARLDALLRAHAGRGGLAVVATHGPLPTPRPPSSSSRRPAPRRPPPTPSSPPAPGHERRRSRCSRRELALPLRSGGGFGLGVGFFLIVALMVPLGIGPDPARLAGVAAGTLWLGALLACLLSLDRLFQADWEDGTLDQLALAPLPLEAIVALKALAHWLTTGLPLVVAAPLLALTLNLPAPAYPWLVASLAAGTPALSLIGAIGAALTVGIRRGGLLLALLVLPLYLPTLIFGARTVTAAAEGARPLARRSCCSPASRCSPSPSPRSPRRGRCAWGSNNAIAE